MSALTFTLKQVPQQRVDMSPLVCQLLKHKTVAEIAALTLYSGKAKIRVDTLFDLTGSDTDNIVIANSMEKLDYIGKGLQNGSITVEGNAGNYVAMQMRAEASISVTGNVEMFAACEMHSGRLTIHGNAGDFLGGALIGNKKGMCGGTALVKGNVGARAGDHMRRGMILVEGNAGAYCGSRMTAGTIAVMGTTGNYVGYAMRRGTILLWQKPELTATFNDCGSHTLEFLALLFNSFTNLNSKFSDSSNSFNRIQRYAGDLAEIGRGEILVKL